MSYVLHIDTSGEQGAVAISQGLEVLGKKFSDKPMQHASFLQPAVQSLMASLNLGMKKLEAICVSNGPGSYTGLRVGLASAKGLCFALDIPLITLNTLGVMANALWTEGEWRDNADMVCPMIDARRMEVYTTLTTADDDELVSPRPMVLDETSFDDFLKNGTIVFAGNGAPKFSVICQHPNAIFASLPDLLPAQIRLGERALEDKVFANLASAEPFYHKEFYTTKQPS